MPTEKSDELEIRQMSQLSPSEAHRLWGWSDDIFGTVGLNLTYRSKDGVIRFVLSTGDQGAVSHVAVLKHQAAANGSAALIGGIGGVVTIPGCNGVATRNLLVPAPRNDDGLQPDVRDDRRPRSEQRAVVRPAHPREFSVSRRRGAESQRLAHRFRALAHE